MALAIIEATNLESGKRFKRQKTFDNEHDALTFLREFDKDFIKIHRKRVISGIDFINLRLKLARQRASR